LHRASALLRSARQRHRAIRLLTHLALDVQRLSIAEEREPQCTVGRGPCNFVAQFVDGAEGLAIDGGNHIAQLQFAIGGRPIGFDFADENALRLALEFPHVLVARTFSKAYSLCFQRVGYFVGHAELIAALDKIRDSYNVNGLGQIAATATLDDLKFYRANFKKIVATRAWLSRELTKLGFRVLPSQTNFILARPSEFPAKDWLQKLREQKILVRWFSAPEVSDYLRITIGTPAEAEALVRTTCKILAVSQS